MGCVGGANCTVAVGRATDLVGNGADARGLVAGAARPGIGPAVFSGMVGAPVGAPVFSLIVGAGAGRAMPAVLRGIVGAGVGAEPVGDGAPMVGAGIVAAGGLGIPTVGVGGLMATGGATGTVGGVTGAVGGTGVTVAEGAAGTSLAFSVTRTVSFFKGMLEVCLDGVFWSSLMGLMVCEL